MIDTTKLRFPGEFNIEKIELLSYSGFRVDLQSNMLEIVFYEDIDSPCLLGEIVIAENVNLIKNVPIIGNETLSVKITTPSRTQSLERTFFVYKISDKMEADTHGKAAVYRLHFASEEYITAETTKISRSFHNRKYSDMVKSICRVDLKTSKPVSTQKTLGNKHIVIPYCSPIEAIKLIASKSMSEDSKDYAYMFYETFDGFFFQSINKNAVDASPQAEYTYAHASLSTGSVIYKDIEKDFYRIESYGITELCDTIDNVRSGLFSSGLLIHDITTKSFETKSFSYNPQHSSLHTIDKEGILPRNGDRFSSRFYSNYKYIPRQSFAYDGIQDNETANQVLLKRHAHLAHFKNYQMSILVAGDSQRRVGDLVEVNIPVLGGPLDKESPNDPYLSGKYMVAGVTHIIQKEVYKMRLRLERDSLPVAYPDISVFKA